MLFNSLSTQFKVMISPQFPFLTVLMIIRAVMEITCYVTKVWGFLLLLCGCSTWIVQYIENSSKEISQGERKHGFLEACSFSAILNDCYPVFLYCLLSEKCVPKPQPARVAPGPSLHVSCLCSSVCASGNAALLSMYEGNYWNHALMLNPDLVNLMTNPSYSCIYFWSCPRTVWIKLMPSCGSTGYQCINLLYGS